MGQIVRSPMHPIAPRAQWCTSPPPASLLCQQPGKLSLWIWVASGLTKIWSFWTWDQHGFPNRKPMVILVDSPHINRKASNFCGDSFISHVMVKLLVVWAHSAGVSLCTSRCGAQPLPGLLIHQIIQDCNCNHVHTRFVSFRDDDKPEVSFNIIHSTIVINSNICIFSGWL